MPIDRPRWLNKKMFFFWRQRPARLNGSSGIDVRWRKGLRGDGVRVFGLFLIKGLRGTDGDNQSCVSSARARLASHRYTGIVGDLPSCEVYSCVSTYSIQTRVPSVDTEICVFINVMFTILTCVTCDRG